MQELNTNSISKLPNVRPTIFTTISSLAIEHNAINLGQGFPDFEMDSPLIELVNKAMINGKNQYVHSNGLHKLREVIADKVEKLHKAKINSETEITITPGATYAIYTALTSILHPGDEVIIFEPAYDSYSPNIEINGAITVPINLKFPDYDIDWSVVKSKITAKTKAIIINSPHNPTGSLLTHQDMLQLQNIVKDTNIYILSDEVYEHLVFDNKKHVTVLSYPELYSRSFVCFSFGKVYNCTGWKIGYCIAPKNMSNEFRKVHQFNCFSCFGPVQYALAEYIPNQKYLAIAGFLQKKRDYFENALKNSKLIALPSSGTYFQLYSYKNISNETGYEFAINLVKNIGVAAIPVSAFYNNPVENHVLRFCFAKKEETLKLAADQLMKL